MKTSDIHIRDPYILSLPEEGRYLLFGTTGKNAWSGPGLGFDCYESRDLENWTGPIPAFRPSADFWSNTQFWAPECHPWQGRYFLLASFAKDERQRGTQILVADKPEGPYRLHSDGPVTPRDWECLDGTLFVDDHGKPWMVFCHEWVQVGDGEMCALPLTDDLHAAAGEPTLLFRASQATWAKPFEAHGRTGNRVTDGPFLHCLAGGALLMLWSTLGHEGYAMGYAVSDSGDILGPWRQSDAPIYSQDGGHGMLFHDFGGRLWLTLHQPNNSPNERPRWLEVVENGEGLAIRDSVNLYPAPDGIAASDRFGVTINGRPSFTYLTTGPAKVYYTAGHTASWTSFDMNGPCEVRIRRLGRPVRSAVVRPLSAGIRPRIEDGEVVLELDRPRKLCVECDGDLTDVLFLFANAPETAAPSPDDPDVVWFGPGVHEIGKFYPLKPATTYYLAPGAFLKGSFSGGGDGTRVLGRGVLSGADYDWPGDLQEKNPARVDLVKLAGNGLELAGVTLVDSPYYVVIAGGRNNCFRDLKILAWHSNTDGISAGPGARIDDCFLRVADDAFKPFVSDTRIARCVLWVDKASVFQLTWNALRDSGGSEVRDCDVIHHMPFCTQDSEWVGAVFWSWHGGHAHIHDLLFEDIRIEGKSPCLLRLFMRRNPWSPQEGGWGHFSRLVFRHIACEQPFRFPSRLLGHDDAHPVADVAIENLTIAGRHIDSPAAMDMETNKFVPGLRMDGTVVPRVIFQPGPEYVDANRCFGIASSVTRTPGGRLWCGFTSGGEGEGHLNYGMVVTSGDGGMTWTRQVPNGIRHTNSRFVFMKLRSGNWLLVKHGSLDAVSEAREDKYPANVGRSHLTAFLSRDEGRTWDGGLLLDERECSYPFGCQADDGTVYLSYERNRWHQPEILLARFREEDVQSRRPVSGQVALRILVNKALGSCPGRSPE